jgi:hypothetical protein
MHRTGLLIVTAVAEAGTGLVLLFLPSILFSVLLGVSSPASEAVFIARIFGVALLAIGVGCWLARSDPIGSAQRGVLTGVLIYDVGAAALLAYAGLALNMAGIALWPAVVLHTALAVWCLTCLRNQPSR